MENRICSRSSILFLFLNGKIEDLLTPWYFCVDFSQEIIIVKKRNWYLIGTNENVHAFRFIRGVNIHQHIFGADIEVKSMGNISKAFCLPKNEAEKLKNVLIDYNKKRKGGFIIS